MHCLSRQLKASLAAVDLTLEVVTAAAAGGRVLRVAARPIPYVPGGEGLVAVAESVAVSGVVASFLDTSPGLGPLHGSA
jgi:hypothetical protein